MFVVEALDGYFLAQPRVQEFLDSCISVVGRRHIRFDENHQPYSDLLYSVRFGREDEYIIFVTDYVDPHRLMVSAMVEEMSKQITKDIDAQILQDLRTAISRYQYETNEVP